MVSDRLKNFRAVWEFSKKRIYIQKNFCMINSIDDLKKYLVYSSCKKHI